MTYHTPNFERDVRAVAGDFAPSFIRLIKQWREDVKRLVVDMPVMVKKQTRASSPRPRWTEAEDKFVQENYLRLGAKRIGGQLKRSDVAVRVRAQKLGVARSLA